MSLFWIFWQEGKTFCSSWRTNLKKLKNMWGRVLRKKQCHKYSVLLWVFPMQWTSLLDKSSQSKLNMRINVRNYWQCLKSHLFHGLTEGNRGSSLALKKLLGNHAYQGTSQMQRWETTRYTSTTVILLYNHFFPLQVHSIYLFEPFIFSNSYPNPYPYPYLPYPKVHGLATLISLFFARLMPMIWPG